MSEGNLSKITSVLEDILVFEANFKEEILLKAKELSEEKAGKLLESLVEVRDWQEKVLAEKIKEDPGFYNKIVNARKTLDQKIINLYKQKLNEEDRKKMEIILNKMKSI